RSTVPHRPGRRLARRLGSFAALVLFPWCLCLTIAQAQQLAVGDTPVPRVPHTTGTYVIDGALDDGIWESALTFELLLETNPRENEPAPVTTRGYIVESGTSLLVAFDAKDPNPELIRAYLRD